MHESDHFVLITLLLPPFAQYELALIHALQMRQNVTKHTPLFCFVSRKRCNVLTSMLNPGEYTKGIRYMFAYYVYWKK